MSSSSLLPSSDIKYSDNNTGCEEEEKVEDVATIPKNNPSTSVSSLILPVSVMERIQQPHPHPFGTNEEDEDTDTTTTTTTLQSLWSDRIRLQNLFTLSEKGWQVLVEWKVSMYGGMGVFAQQSIRQGTILRIGILQQNLIPFHSVSDIETFCHMGGPNEYIVRLQYVQDYLWGYYPSHRTDINGYPYTRTAINNNNKHHHHHGNDINHNPSEEMEERFFGMWIPGNGLNHHPIPNVVYRNDDEFRRDMTNTTTGTTTSTNRGILYLMALTDIQTGDELYDDYRRHGTTAPLWLKNYATEKNITLNFADCNDFVR